MYSDAGSKGLPANAGGVSLGFQSQGWEAILEEGVETHSIFLL